MQVNLKQTHPAATIPTYATQGAAGFDLTAAECGPEWRQAGYHAEFDTGLAFEIPPGWFMLLCGRSGFAFNHGAHLITGASIVDSDYRGSVRVKYTAGIPAAVGDRIAQAIILPYEKIEFVMQEYLSDTERGEGGFGSTGL